MSIILGYVPDEHGKDALSLAGMLARSAGEPLVVLTAVRRPWPLPLSGPEAEEMEEHARMRFEDARRILEEDIPVEHVIRRTRSVPAALLDLAAEREAGLLVLGSGRDGVLGTVALGSASNHVLHTARVAVALVPRGMRCAKGSRVNRVSVAFGGSERTSVVAIAAAAKAVEYGASMRLVSFLARSRPDITMTLGVEGETGILETWAAEMGLALNRAMDELRELPDPPALETPQVGQGSGWQEALEDVDWTPGDVLVLGSSQAAPASRVFLGSRANKILKHSPVPVIVLPAAQAEELAERAEA